MLLRIRNWLILLLAGKRSCVVINVHIHGGLTTLENCKNALIANSMFKK